MFGSIKKVKKGLPRVNPTAGFFGFLFKQLFTALAICFLALLSFLFFSSENPDPPFSLSTIKKASKHSKPLLPSVLGEETSSESPLVLTGNLSSDNPVPASQSFLIKNCRDCIDGKQIKNNSIGSSEIENKSITSSDIKSNQINSRTIENHSIRSRDLARNLTIQHLTVDNELIVLTTLSAPFLNTGQGNNELYAMDQDVKTTDTPFFAGLTLTGNLLFSTDNTLDIGTTGATRPRTGYFGTSIISPLINGLTITNNGTNTLNIAAGKTLTASNTLTFTGTDSSSIAFGAGGTVVYTSDKLSSFAATTSAELAGVISDETGSSSGVLVFNNAPTITSPVITNIAPGANFTLTQNSVVPFTSVNSGAVANTLYLALGNVGIGTTAPLGKLIIGNSGTYAGAGESFGVDDGSTSYSIRVHSATTAASAKALLEVQQRSTGDIARFYQGTTQHVTISNTGNVGIGTTSPGQKLDVAGNITLSTGGYVYGDTNTPSIYLNTAVGSSLNYGGATATSFFAGSNILKLYTNSTERVRIQSDGNVGIGTTGPGKLFHVYGTGAESSMIVENNTASNGVFYYWKKPHTVSGTSNWALGSYGNSNDLRVWDGSSDMVTFQKGGNVGIGTTSPRANLTVGTVGGSYRIQLDGSTSNILGFGNGEYTGSVPLYNSNITTAITADTGTSMTFNISSGGNAVASNVLVLKGTGNVGIGTTSPSQLLNVYGSSPRILAESSAANGAGFWSKNTSTEWFAGLKYDTADAYQIANATGPKVTILTGGNVGIGTTGPGKLFHVYGTGAESSMIVENNTASNGVFYYWKKPHTVSGTSNWALGSYGNSNDLRVWDGSSDMVTFQKGGNVGIGTTAPGAKLDVRDAGSATVPALGTAGTGIRLARENGQVGLDIGYVTDGNSYLQAQRTDSAVAYNLLLQPVGGNVGIGTTNPGAKLEINGGVKVGTTQELITSGMWYQTTGPKLKFSPPAGGFGWNNNANDTELMTLTNAGNVGIGTTSPGLALDVVGNARFSAIGAGAYTAAVNQMADGTLTTATSDARLKKDIATIDNPLNKVLALRGVTFNWTDPNNPKRMLGMIAQEVNAILPELVFQNSDGYYGINYGETSGLLVEAIKQQQGEIAGITNNQNKIVQQLTGQLADQSLSVNEKLNLIGASLEQLTADDLASLQEQLTTQALNIADLQENKIDQNDLDLATAELNLALTNLESRVLSLETSDLPVEFQALQSALLGAKIEFDAEGNLKVRKLKTRMIELEKNETPPACQPEIEGAFYYDFEVKAFLGCDGKHWNKLLSEPIIAPEIPAEIP